MPILQPPRPAAYAPTATKSPGGPVAAAPPPSTPSSLARPPAPTDAPNRAHPSTAAPAPRPRPTAHAAPRPHLAPPHPFVSPRPAAPPASVAPSRPSPPTAFAPPEAPPAHALPLAAPPPPRPLTAAKRARTTPPPSPSRRPDLEDTLTATPSPAAPHNRERSLDRPPLHGVLADRYTIRARLDEGGEGVVYEAWDPLEHRPLALKVRSRLVGPDHLLLKREYQALAAVAHPNVARAFDLVEDPDRGLAFFTMELVQGVDIVAHVRRAAPRDQLQADLDRLRRAVRQIASGLQAIHATGRAHRDIKPSNILVTADGRAVIVDFGLAARLSGGDHLTLRARRVEGTPHYMAPEQLCADAPITPACDAYALGVVLYEALTGRWPLDADSLTELITLKTYRRPPPPSAHVHGVPADLDALVARLLERDPDERATLTDLLAWCGDATHPHAPPPLPHRAPSPATTPLASHHKPQGRLAAAIRHLNRREPFTLLLHGPAGAGKSGLVRRVLTALREHAPQALILAGRCSPRESVPFRALDAILDALAAFLITCPKDHLAHLLAGGTAHLARLFPVFARVPGVDAPLTLADPTSSARERAFAELRALLHRLAAARPLVLTIDDLHRGDRDSLRLLDALTAPPDPPPLLLIATLRCTPEEAQATADALHGEREFAHVRLPTADEATPVAYERLRAAGRDDPDLAAALACACAGDVRLIDRLAAIVARRPPHTTAARPLHLADLLAPALDALAPLPRRLLDLVALADAPTPVDVLDHAAAARGKARPELTHLADLRLIEIEAPAEDPRDATAECISPALRAALLGLLSADRRVELHRALALAHQHSPQGDEERCAHHHIAAGDPAAARDHAASAALIATRAHAHAHAAQLLEIALRCDPQNREIRQKLAAALAAAGDLSAAAGHYLRSARLATGRRRIDHAVAAADLFYLSGDQVRGHRAALGVFAELGLDLGDDDTRARHLLDRQRARLAGHPLAFVAHTRAAIGGECIQRVEALLRLGRHLRDHDPQRAAIALTAAALDALSLGEPGLIAPALALTAATIVADDRPLARRLLARAAEIARGLDDERSAGLTALSRALVALHEGDPLTALTDLAIADDALIARRIADRWEQRTITLARLAAHDALGDLAALAAALTALTADPQSAADPNLRPWLALYEGLLFAARGEADRAELRSVTALKSLAARDPRLALALTARIAAHCDLHRGLPRKAWSRVLGPKGALTQSRPTAPDPRLPAHHWPLLDARVALACAAAPTRDRALHRQILHRALAELAILTEHVPSDSGLHGELALLRAGLAHLDGDAPRAIAHLRHADAAFLHASMSTARAVTQLRLGDLLGGSPGALAAASARQQLRREGILDPDRWADALAPALPRPCPHHLHAA